MTDWIKQHKQIVIFGFIGFVLVCVLCCGILVIITPAPNTTIIPTAIPTAIPTITTRPTNTITAIPTNTQQPTVTATSIPTPMIDEITLYKMKVFGWSQRLNHITTVVVSVLRKEPITNSELAQTGTDLILLRTELHAYNPPEVFIPFHQHFTNGVDDLYNAIVALSENRLSDAVLLLEHGKSEMDKARESMPVDIKLDA